MSNTKNANYKKKAAPAKPKKKKKYEDDRTPAVKRIDFFCKCLAILCAFLLLADAHILIRGGGYEDSKIVHVLGFSVSKVESDVMAPEVMPRSGIISKTSSSYEVGDIVQYLDESTDPVSNPVRRIVDISEDGKTYTVLGDNEADINKIDIKASDISGGKVIVASTGLYDIFKVMISVIGCAIFVILSFLFLLVPDFFMYKKRKAALEAKREAQAKKEARKLRVKQGLDVEPDEEDIIEKRRAEKQAKLDKERAEIAAEMKEIQKKMKEEEKELKKGKGGK